MKLKFSKLFKAVFLSSLFVGGAFSIGYAQKAEDVQNGSVWVQNVKIDGKTTDWATPLKAENKSTGLAYTVANDDKNLYVLIQSSDTQNNTKIMMGGISFIINPEGKKKDKDAFILTYPIVNRSSRRSSFSGGSRSGTSMRDMDPAQRDSMMMAMGRTQLASAKDIKVSGFSNITDSLISIYNEYGIKAAADFSENGVFNYEISIPLSELKMSADKPKEFSYSLKVNGLQMRSFGGGDSRGGESRGGGSFGGGGRSSGGGSFGGGEGGRGMIDFQALVSPTFFWGKYTLTNK